MRTGSTTGRPRRPSRVGVVAVLAWTLAVVAGGAIAWQALAAVDSGGRTGVLSQHEVTAALDAALATASPAPTTPAPTTRAPTHAPLAALTPAPDPPTPTPSSVPTPSATHPPAATTRPAPAGTVPPASVPAASAVARTWTVPGGIVAVACTGADITLLYATPSDGWTVEVGSTGPQHVEVQLQRDGAETKVSATCVAGTPEPRVESDDDASDGRWDRRGSDQVTPSPERDG